MYAAPAYGRVETLPSAAHGSKTAVLRPAACRLDQDRITS